MARFLNKNDKRSFSNETVQMGSYIHSAGDLLILKLESRDVPYPNSPVIFNKDPVGKVDEVFGPVDDVYVSVKLDAKHKIENFKLQSTFQGYKEKFMPKHRFLPREEVEKRKLMKDKKEGTKMKNFKKANNKSGGFQRNERRDGKDSRGFNGDSKRFGDNGDSKRFNDNKDSKRFNNNKVSRGFNGDSKKFNDSKDSRKFHDNGDSKRFKDNNDSKKKYPNKKTF